MKRWCPKIQSSEETRLRRPFQYLTLLPNIPWAFLSSLLFPPTSCCPCTVPRLSAQLAIESTRSKCQRKERSRKTNQGLKARGKTAQSSPSQLCLCFLIHTSVSLCLSTVDVRKGYTSVALQRCNLSMLQGSPVFHQCTFLICKG